MGNVMAISLYQLFIHRTPSTELPASYFVACAGALSFWRGASVNCSRSPKYCSHNFKSFC